MQLLDRYLDFLYVRTLIDSYLHNGSAIDADYCPVSLIMEKLFDEDQKCAVVLKIS